MEEANQGRQCQHSLGHSDSLAGKPAVATTTLKMSCTGVAEEKRLAGRHSREHLDDYYYYLSFTSLVKGRAPASDSEGGRTREVEDEQSPCCYCCSPGGVWRSAHADACASLEGGSWMTCEEEGAEMVTDTLTFCEHLQNGDRCDSNLSKVLAARRQVLGTRQGTPRKERAPSGHHSVDPAKIIFKSDEPVVVSDSYSLRVTRSRPGGTAPTIPLFASCSESDAAVSIADTSGQRISRSHPGGTTTIPVSASSFAPLESYHAWEDNMDEGGDEDDGVSIFFIPSDNLHPSASVIVGLEENAHGEDPQPSASVLIGLKKRVLNSCSHAVSVPSYEMW